MDLVDTGLSEAQLRAARLIAMGMGYKDVATELGVNRTTLYRWRRSPAFSEQVSRLMASAREGVQERVIRDVAEVKDLVLDTLIDVARNSTQDSARVAAARTLGEFMERAEERARQNQNDVMRDQSGEIRAILEHIRQEKLCSSGSSQSAPK